MNPGAFTKIGHWYEERYVVWLALRLLDESIIELVWEGRHDDERGIDAWIRDAVGARIAIQCKTRSTGQWTIPRLKRKRVFEHARLQLAEREEPDRASRYEFVTDTTAVDWTDAIEAAQAGSLPNDHKLVDELGPDAPDLLRRMKVRTIGQECVDDMAMETARGLVPGPDARRLVEAVGRVLRNILGKVWTAHGLRSELDRDSFDWAQGPPSSGFLSTFLAITDEFVTAIEDARGLPRHLVRPEQAQLAEAVLAAPPGSLVLVRGAPGSGKSEVLASLVGPARSSGAMILALNASELRDSPSLRLPPYLPLKLRNLAGHERTILLIDQVDQLARGGANQQPSLRPVARVVRRARSLGLVVVVGCRSLEASRVVQLENLLGAAGPGSRKDVEVDDLPEAPVAELLADRGIPLDDLNLEMRQLVRRPIVLSLLVRLIDGPAAWSGVRSQLELIERWCDFLSEEYGPEAIAVLDALAERMDDDGTTSASRALLPHPTTVDALIGARILIESAGGRIRPFHQVVTDTRLALQFAKVDDARELRERLGARSAQDLHRARRLRLAVPVVAERGERGAAIIESLLRDDSIRPLLKHAILMGLATVESPGPALVRLVRDQLQSEDRRDAVARTVVYEHEGWMEALDADLDPYWQTWPRQRDLLLQLLASVSRRRGKNVAAHLQRWSEADPDVLTRARMVFWHDPSEDCDEQFELRVGSPWVGPDGFPVDWSKFMAQSPLRSVRLLVESLKRTPQDAITNDNMGGDWMHEWPSGDEIPDAVLGLGLEHLVGLRSWWAELDVSDERVDELIRHGSGACILVRVADLLARALARSLAIGEIDWDRLLAWMPRSPQPPRPLRRLDAWLFLQVGALLPEGTSSRTADAAAGWFEREEVVAEFLRDARWSAATARVAKKFLDGVASNASTEVASRLRAREGELSEMRAPTARIRFGFGRPEPAVSLEDAGEWTPKEWIDKLMEAPEPRDPPTGDGRWIDDSRDALAGLLVRAATQNPQRYLDHARTFGCADSMAPAEARQAVLSGLTASSNVDRVDASDLESILLMPAYLDAPECASTVGQVVRDRPDHPWGTRVLERLVEIAAEGLAALALYALASIAFRQPARRGFVLDSAERFIELPDVLPRAAAAYAAACAQGVDPVRAARAVLVACKDDRVAAAPDVAPCIQWIAWDEAKVGQDQSVAARSRILGLARSSDLAAASAAGESLLFLRHHDLVSKAEFDAALMASPAARLGASRRLGLWLIHHDADVTDRMREVAVAFANDDDRDVRRAILSAFLGRGESTLLDDREFLARMVQSRAVGEDMQNLLHAFDRRGTLLPLKDEVLAMTDRLLSSPLPTGDPWEGRYQAEKACETLSRLIEEAEREEDLDVRNRALDAWDRLLEGNLGPAMRTLSVRLDGSESRSARERRRSRLL